MIKEQCVAHCVRKRTRKIEKRKADKEKEKLKGICRPGRHNTCTRGSHRMACAYVVPFRVLKFVRGKSMSVVRSRDDQPCTLEEPDSRGAYRVPARSLKVIWGNDPRFWQWTKFSQEELKSTGFQEGAMLLQVNWLEVTGKLSRNNSKLMNTPSTRDYEIYYVVKFQSDAFGWRSVPVKFKVRVNGKEEVNKVMLESYREKDNVWQEIYGGHFTVSSDRRAGVVEFGMYEVESNWWKGSMVLAGIKIKPKAAVPY